MDAELEKSLPCTIFFYQMNRRKFVAKTTFLLPLAVFSSYLFASAASDLNEHEEEFDKLVNGLKDQMSYGLDKSLYLREVTQYLEPVNRVRFQKLQDIRSYTFQNKYGHTIKCQISDNGTKSYLINVRQ